MNDEENILRELALAWEQLSIFYDWDSQIIDIASGEKQLQKIICRLTKSTGSSCGMAIKLGRGSEAGIIASYSPGFDDVRLFLEHFRNSLPDTRERLSHGAKTTIKFVLSGDEHHMLAIPWKKEKKLSGAFVFARPGLPYGRAETVLLSNATHEISLLMDYASLSSRSQERNNEFGTLVIKNLEGYGEMFPESGKLGSSESEICNILLPEGTKLFGISKGNVFFSSVPGKNGTSASDILPNGIISVLGYCSDEDSLYVDGKVFSIKHHEDERGNQFSTIIETIERTPLPEEAGKLHKVAGLATKEALRRRCLNMLLQEAYASTLASMSSMIGLTSPQTNLLKENTGKLISMLSRSLGLDAGERNIVEKSSMLVDVSLAYMDHRTLEEYLVKGTTVAGPETMRAIMEHPIRSAELIQPVESLSGCVPVIRTHHERWDGYGYPMGLKGDEIPKLSRVLAFVQALSSRISQHSMDLKDFMQMESERVWLSRQAGRAFDPDIVKMFLESF